MPSNRPSYEHPGLLAEARKRSTCERLAVPYVFSPNLSLGEAAAAALGAFARIFLGSLLFALWGVSSVMIWNSMDSHFWRAVITVPLVLVLLVSLGGLMLGITAIGNLITPRAK
ncbi:MAG: hypothetical protein ABSB35_16450 [Bryobacteraceae bacterium]|jgi:hypothetical protein